MNAGELVEKILSATKLSNDEKSRTVVWTLLRLHYYKLARRTSWELMRKTLTITAPASDVWLPSDLIDIDRVRDTNSLFDYYRRDAYDVEPDEGGYRFTVKPGSDDPLHVGKCRILHNQLLIQSSTAGSTDADGEYCRVGNLSGYWKILSGFTAGEATLSATYTGPTLSDATLIVRPSETKKLFLYEENEQQVTTAGVEVYYWAYPRQLFNDYDEILLPDPTWLELSILRDWPDARANRPVNINELRDAEQMCLGMNKVFQRRDPARDVRNRAYKLHGSMFGERT